MAKVQAIKAKTPHFESILDRPSEDAERPKPLPQGSYLCVVSGLPEYGKSSKKQTDFVAFNLIPQQALDDVDTDALEEIGGLEGKSITDTYYLTPNAEYRLREFLDHCGVPSRDDDDEKLSHRARIEMATNCQVIAFIKHEPSQDGTSVFARVSGTAAVE